jgi:hypothetical protein
VKGKGVTFNARVAALPFSGDGGLGTHRTLGGRRARQ